MKKILLISLFIIQMNRSWSQTNTFKPAKVDFDSYEKLVKKVKPHRAKRLIPLDTFLAYSKDSNTIVLDTRSDYMYNGSHIKGAINLPFSDINNMSLQKMIGDKSTRILIYCNNNIDNEPKYYISKAIMNHEGKEVYHALNVPTYICLYGYGYQNVYELSELVSIKDPRVQFESSINNTKQAKRAIINR